MQKALVLAKKAALSGEVPVGAVLILDNQVLAGGWNCPIATLDPTAHAETVVLRAAATVLNNYRLLNTHLYVTLEPCLMCVGALIQARIGRLIFGAWDSKAGAVQSICQGFELPSNHRINYAGGLLAADCADLLTRFFRQKRSHGHSTNANSG